MTEQLPVQWSPEWVQGEILSPRRIDSFKAVLQDGQSPERFALMVMEHLRGKDKIIAAARNNPAPFWSALSELADLGLSLYSAKGEAALTVRKGAVALSPMYRGLRNLVLRTGKVYDCYARLVFKGDRFEPHEGTEPHIVHVPVIRGRQPSREEVICGYAVAIYTDGRKHTEIEEPWEILLAREAAETKYGWDGPHWGEFWKKTLLRRLTKNLDLDSDKLARAEKLDNDDYVFENAGRPARQLKPPPMLSTKPRVAVSVTPPPALSQEHTRQPAPAVIGHPGAGPLPEATTPEPAAEASQAQAAGILKQPPWMTKDGRNLLQLVGQMVMDIQKKHPDSQLGDLLAEYGGELKADGNFVPGPRTLHGIVWDDRRAKWIRIVHKRVKAAWEAAGYGTQDNSAPPGSPSEEVASAAVDGGPSPLDEGSPAF